MKAIPNQLDIEVADRSLEKIETSLESVGAFSLSALEEADLDTCETAVKKCARATSALQLATALLVRHIVVNRLYEPLFASPSDYFKKGSSRLNLSKTQLSRYLNSGIAYYQYRHKLDDAGFQPNGHYSKLAFLARAIDLHGENEAVRALCSMTYDEYTSYSKGETARQINYTSLDLDVSMSAQGIAVEGKDVVKLADVKKIVDAGSEPYLVALDSPGEKAAINNFLKSFRSKK